MADSLKIFGWMADHSGCGWYRIILPLGTLREAGKVQTRFGGRMLEDDWDADIFVAQRTHRPGPSQVLQRLAKAPNGPLVVYELDDDLLSVGSDNPAAKVFNEPDTRANIVTNIRAAHLVTVSTEPLAEKVAKFNPNVVVLPNCVFGEMLDWRHGGYADRFTIGWQGSPTHDRDWSEAARAVAAWFRRNRDVNPPVEMHTIGAVPKDFPQLHRHRHTPWSPDLPRYYMSIDWDVALAPLHGSTFNRSKSDIRVLEAAMLGIPVVASRVPAYERTIEAGEFGILASTPKEWQQALYALMTDPVAYRQMSDKARAYARTRTIEANADRWLEAYRSAL